MDVIQLRNPQALTNTHLQGLLRRAIESNVLVSPGNFDEMAPDMLHFVTDDHAFMLVGFEKGDFKAVMMGFLPVGHIFPYPNVAIFYNEGTRKLGAAVKRKLMDILLQKGYTRLLAVNGTGRDDAVWQRAMEMKGFVSGKRVGSLVMFEVE